MSSVLKATIENKTTSVTTHFKEINKEQRVYCLGYCLKQLSHPAGVALAYLARISAAGRRAVTHCEEHTDVPASCDVRTSRSSSLICGPQTARTWMQSIALFVALQQTVYQRRQFKTINQLKQAIVTEWGRWLLERFIDGAICPVSD